MSERGEPVLLDTEVAVLHYYSSVAHDIYEKRTAGDFTWTGLLAMAVKATDRVRNGEVLQVDAIEPGVEWKVEL
jgi:hypothetical protein